MMHIHAWCCCFFDYFFDFHFWGAWELIQQMRYFQTNKATYHVVSSVLTDCLSRTPKLLHFLRNIRSHVYVRLQLVALISCATNPQQIVLMEFDFKCGQDRQTHRWRAACVWEETQGTNIAYTYYTVVIIVVKQEREVYWLTRLDSPCPEISCSWMEISFTATAQRVNKTGVEMVLQLGSGERMCALSMCG